jgi:sialic acid synthase SpsE
VITKFKKLKRPIIITEISGNHNGSKKSFLSHIKIAAKNGADIIKIQTYEPEDITLKKFDKSFKIKKLFQNMNKKIIYRSLIEKFTS